MTRPLVVVALALALAVAACLIAVSASAQEPTVSVEVEPSTGLTVGDPFTVRMMIMHGVNDSVVIGDSLVEMGGMEPAAPVVTVVSETETLVVLQTRSFRTGGYRVELPTLTIQRGDGSMVELPVDPILVTVASVLGGDARPRPNTAPDLLEDGGRTFTPLIVAIVGIGAGFVLARLARRWTRLRTPVEKAVEAHTPTREVALFEMDDSLEPAEQCRRLASTVRSRLSDDWPLPASALTASEIGPALAAAGAPGVVVLRVTRLLEACDRVQYGGEQPVPERLHGYVELARAIWSEPSEEGAS